MVERIFLTQFIALIIMDLFILQKNGGLEKNELLNIAALLFILACTSYVIICSTIFEISSLNLLMLASLNGLATIFYVVSRKYKEIK